MGDFFELELLREQYALENKDEEFMKTYTDASLPEIPNENTSSHWNTSLAINDDSDNFDNMTRDRIAKTATLVTGLTFDPLNILDIGIGNGWVEKVLLRLRKKNKVTAKIAVTGVDIAEKQLNTLKQELLGVGQSGRKFKGEFLTGEFLQGDVLNLPHGLKTYNCILLLEVLEHISPRDTFGALKQVKKHLEVGGTFILSVPIYENLKEKIAAGENASCHVRRYTPAVVKKELQLAGFQVDSIQYLFAFNNLYRLKSLIARVFKTHKPNVMVVKTRTS